MGLPVERSELERSNTRTLAALIVDSVICDEEPPVDRMSPDAVKETVWAFAQEIVQLSTESADAIATWLESTDFMNARGIARLIRARAFLAASSTSE